MSQLTIEGAGQELTVRLSTLERVLSSYGKAVVAFSGGVDSSFLAWSAGRVLSRDSLLCVTADSPSLASSELQECKSLMDNWNLEWQVVLTREFENEEYVKNDGNRCFHCKTELISALQPLASDFGATILLGVNTDDLGEHRPGQQAALNGGAKFPLVESGFSKRDVRNASKLVGLSIWDKPAQACLASRVPYGTPVTINVLRNIGLAEAELRNLGFRDVRVRYYGETARIEVGEDELSRAVEFRHKIVSCLKKSGFDYVTLDLEGFKSGNLNRVLRKIRQ